MTGDFKVAGVKFCDGSNSNSTYYYALYDDDIIVGDTVAVQTGHHGMGIVKIVSIDNDNFNKVQYGREIVDKIDLTKFQERKAKIAKLKELKNKMDAKVKELQKSAIYEMLAEKDEDLKSLLEEYKSITD